MIFPLMYLNRKSSFSSWPWTIKALSFFLWCVFLTLRSIGGFALTSTSLQNCMFQTWKMKVNIKVCRSPESILLCMFRGSKLLYYNKIWPKHITCIMRYYKFRYTLNKHKSDYIVNKPVWICSRIGHASNPSPTWDPYIGLYVTLYFLQTSALVNP